VPLDFALLFILPPVKLVIVKSVTIYAVSEDSQSEPEANRGGGEDVCFFTGPDRRKMLNRLDPQQLDKANKWKRGKYGELVEQ